MILHYKSTFDFFFSNSNVPYNHIIEDKNFNVKTPQLSLFRIETHKLEIQHKIPQPH